MKIRFQKHVPSETDLQKELGPEGYVQLVQKNHLKIYCYNRQAFRDGFSNPDLWTETVRNARGLTYYTDGTLATPGNLKFWNLGENARSQWQPEYDQMQLIALEKFNGHCSFIIWDKIQNKPRVLTKGSAEHEFEDYGLQHLENDNLYGFPENWKTLLQQGHTFLAENIHPDDPHTCSNRYQPGLYLFAAVKPDQTYEIDLNTFPGEVHTNISLEQALQLQNQAPHEGYVLYLVENQEVQNIFKLKSPGYIKKRQEVARINEVAKSDEIFTHWYKNASQEIHYNPEPAKELLDDFYDDWIAARQNLLTQMQSNFNTWHQEANQLVAEVKVEDKPTKEQMNQYRKTLALKLMDKETGKPNHLMAYVMATLEDHEQKQMNIIQGQWVKKSLQLNEEEK